MKRTLQTLCLPVLLLLLAVPGMAMASMTVLEHGQVAQPQHSAQAAFGVAFAGLDTALEAAGRKLAKTGAQRAARAWPVTAYRRGVHPLCRAPGKAAPSDLSTPQYAGKASLSTSNSLIPWRSHISCECLSAFSAFAATIAIQN